MPAKPTPPPIEGDLDANLYPEKENKWASQPHNYQTPTVFQNIDFKYPTGLKTIVFDSFRHYLFVTSGKFSLVLYVAYISDIYDFSL